MEELYPTITITFLPQRIDIKVENDEGLKVSQIERAKHLINKTLHMQRAQRRQAAQRVEVTSKLQAEKAKEAKAKAEAAKAAEEAA